MYLTWLVVNMYIPRVYPTTHIFKRQKNIIAKQLEVLKSRIMLGYVRSFWYSDHMLIFRHDPFPI